VCVCVCAYVYMQCMCKSLYLSVSLCVCARVCASAAYGHDKGEGFARSGLGCTEHVASLQRRWHCRALYLCQLNPSGRLEALEGAARERKFAEEAEAVQGGGAGWRQQRNARAQVSHLGLLTRPLQLQSTKSV
jgi:hypothetical protein